MNPTKMGSNNSRDRSPSQYGGCRGYLGVVREVKWKGEWNVT